jgi:two-component system, LuxR family, response regulator FixJ
LLTEQGIIYVVDDDRTVCRSIEIMVQAMGLPTQVFSSAEQFLKSVVEEPYGCLITDIRMLGMSGLQLLKEIAAMKWELPVIVVTGYGDVRLAVESFKAGAFTFLEKPYRDQELWDTIVQALAKSQTSHDQRQARHQVKENLSKLTPEETAVLRELLNSTPMKTIAVKMNFSLRTIDLRRRSILDKLNVATNIELTRMLTKAGIDFDDA